MRPNLVIGLGNPLMGDEGIGWVVAERLASHPRLPKQAEVLCGGTDLLRCADRMEGRTRVILIDALLDGLEEGSVTVADIDIAGLDDRQGHVHHLSAVQAVQLLRTVAPSLRETRFTLIGIGISSAGIGPGLSPRLAARSTAILDRVLEELETKGVLRRNPDGG
jgi:hydrogenase maturation protease